MIHYLKADLWRINRRLPRILAFIICLIIGAAILFISARQKTFNFVKLGESISSVLRYLPVFLAIPNLYFVFEDDLPVKTMQAAIGNGIQRFQVILAKWMEMMLLSLLDCTALLALTCTIGLAKGILLKGSAVTHVAAQICSTLLTIGVMTSLVMILIFHLLHLGLTQLLFFLLTLKPVSLVFCYLEMTHEILAKIQFSRFLLGSNLDAFQLSLGNGRFSFSSLIVILLYWGVGIGVTYRIFRKKELDF